MGLDSYLPLKKSGQSVLDQNLPYRFLHGQPLNPSVNLLIGQLMSDNLFYLKSLLNPFIYAWRLKKYREAFYKSFYRKKTGKYSGETKSATGTRSRRELVEESSFTSNAVSFPSSQSVITLLSFKELEK